MNKHTKIKRAMMYGLLGVMLFLCASCTVSEAFLNELLFGTDSEVVVTENRSIDVSGTYTSPDWGDVVLNQQGNQVTGTYSAGTIEGTLTNGVLEGRWYGAYSNGRMILIFSSDSSRFDGYYTTGTSETPGPNATSGGPWAGQRTGTQAKPSSPETQPAGKAPPTGFTVTGIYRTSLGEMTLYQEGVDVIGVYPQSTLAGKMSGQVLTGRIESLGTTADIRFTFTSDGSNFQGEMLYQGSSYVWNGTKTGSNVNQAELVAKAKPKQTVAPASPPAQPSVAGTYTSPDWGEVVLNQQGNQVTGTYSAGTIEGTLTNGVLEGRWYGAYSNGRMILIFSSDSSRFDGYYTTGTSETPGPNATSGGPWAGQRTGTAAPAQHDEVRKEDNLVQIEKLYGGWIDVNEDMSGFVFNADTSLLLFFDGDIAEGYWDSNGDELTLFVKTNEGKYVTFEGTYTFDGTDLLLSLDGDDLVLEKHWVRTIEDIRAFNTQAGMPQVVLGSIAGTYDTNFGKMTLTQTGSSVSGEYPMGTVIGTYAGNVYAGTFESMGITGTFSLTFSSDGSAFEGKMIVNEYSDYLWIGSRL